MRIAGVTGTVRRAIAGAGILILVPFLLAACGGGDEGLTRTEVEEIVREELAAESPAMTGLTRSEVEEIVREELAAESPAMTGLTRSEVEEIVREGLAAESPAMTGLTRSEVEEIVTAAIAAIPEPRPGLTADEAERIAIAGFPPKSAPADYTRHFVDSAIARYETRGLDATLAHYNSAQSIDGQWYVFIIDENDLVIAHPEPERLGLDLNGWVGTDANGYEFGPEMLSTDENGKWVSYVYRNPESGGIGSGFDDVELKNVWVKRRDGLLFASGWYIDADAFTQMLVSAAVDKYRELGLDGTMAYFASPGSVLAGLEAAVGYYNSADTVDGHWFAFIGGPDGRIAGHSDLLMIGGDTRDLFGAAGFDATHATESGEWVESETLRVYVAGYDGYVFGSGWSRDE